MKLEDIKKLNLNLPIFEHDPKSLEITIGDPVAEAKISTTADAWEDIYSRIKGTHTYHHSGQGGISQLEDCRFPGSKDRPKRFHVYLIGIVNEGNVHSLAYSKSIDDDTGKPHTLRKTPISHITAFRDYELILKSGSSHHTGL